MQSRKQTTWLSGVLTVLGLALACAPAMAHGDNTDPHHHDDEKAAAKKHDPLDGPQDKFIKAIKFDQKLDSQVPLDATFKDESGKTVRIGQYFGDKPVILVTIFFECTMLCNEVLQETVRATKDLKFTAGQEFKVVALSIDDRETPELAAKTKAEFMKEYDRPGSENSWHFLTGEEKQIRRVTNSIGFDYEYDPNTDQFAHPNGIVVLTPNGKVARYFYGIMYDRRDLKFGLMEASHERIGSPVDQLLLMCFHYDPITGKYGVLIMNVLRLISGLLVLGIVGGIVLAVRREKQRAGAKNPAGASA